MAAEERTEGTTWVGGRASHADAAPAGTYAQREAGPAAAAGTRGEAGNARSRRQRKLAACCRASTTEES
jgi:hypothetical protein